MTKTFPKSELIALGLPDRGPIVDTKIVEVTRWSVVHEITFKLPGQTDGSAWVAGYSVGATECQDERPWEYDDTIKCTLVRQVEKTVKIWQEADA